MKKLYSVWNWLIDRDHLKTVIFVMVILLAMTNPGRPIVELFR